MRKSHRQMIFLVVIVVSILFSFSMEVKARDIPLRLSLQKGWNFFSFPVVPQETDPDALFSVLSHSKLWSLSENGYVISSSLEAGQGYAVYALQETDIVYQVEVPENTALQLKDRSSGWNLFGVGSKKDIPLELLTSKTVWRFSKGKFHLVTDALFPGEAYWLHLVSAGNVDAGDLVVDSDQDGMPDYWEKLWALDILVDDGEDDSDNDFLASKLEYEKGTNPFSSDSDQDGLLDGDEVSIYKTSPTNTDSDEDGFADGEEVRDHSDPINPDRIPVTTMMSSPANGEGSVAVTRETILRLSRPLSPSVSLTSDDIFATFSGNFLQAMIIISQDRKAISLFYDQELPPSARIRVIVKGDSILDERDIAVDVDGDKKPGGTTMIDFDTLSLTILSGTSICGRVFASELANPEEEGDELSVNRPLKGVLITVDGIPSEELSATTDDNGNFRLEPAPAGRFFVHIDGGNALLDQDAPEGSYYPFVGKAWESIPNEEVNIGNIYLPLILPNTLQDVSQTQETIITFPLAVLQAFPELAGVKITVPADALFSDDGTRGGMVGIAPVPPDRIPGELPLGLQFPIVITVQTDGATNFGQPVPVIFPNLMGLEPNSKSAIWSFNHDTGRFEVIGPSTVTPDGKFVISDPGVGILAPGWHGDCPGGNGGCDPIRGGTGGGGTGGGGTGGGGTGGGGTGGGGTGGGGTGGGGTGGGGTGGGGTCTDELGPDAELFQQLFFTDRGVTIPVVLRDAHCSNSAVDVSTLDDQDVFLTDPNGNVLPGHLLPPLPLTDISSLVVYYRFDAPGKNWRTAPRGLYHFSKKEKEVADIFGNFWETEETTSSNFATRLHGTPEEITSFDLATVLQDTPPDFGNLPIQTGLHYYAVQDIEDGQVWLRGTAGTNGIAHDRIILRPNTTYRNWILQASTLNVGFSEFSTPDSGFNINLPDVVIFPSTATDSDSDGLPDDAEFIMGTNPNDPDSDKDGIPDGAEVQQGTDPLDGFPARTGIIASADTPGTAVDVCALNDIAIVADSAGGISIFNVFNGMNPTIIAQLKTPGNAVSATCFANLIAVADDAAGVTILDKTDVSNTHILHQINVNGRVHAITSAGGIAYAGSNTGRLFAIDMESGSILDTVMLNGSIQDIALGGDYLYVLTAGTLYTLPLVGDQLEVLNKANAPGNTGAGRRRWRLFVGSNIIYVTHTSGYDTFDLTDPENPTLIIAGNSGPFGWKNIVPNAAVLDDNGEDNNILGIAAVGAFSTNSGQHDISLYDLRDPTKTSEFRVAFATPGLAASVSLYNALAYVADSQAGMQVINYLAYDNQETPPTLSLSSSFPLTTTEGEATALRAITIGQAEEGKLVRITANIVDDVQVRNAELYIDNVKVATDGNFPFEFRFITPTLVEQQEFTFAVRASDTGGNVVWSDPITVTLVPDATPPRIKQTSPTKNAVIGSISAVAAFFSEPLDNASISDSPDTFSLEGTGDDEIFGTDDDQLITSGDVRYREVVLGLFMNIPGDLPSGLYRATVSGDISDRAGNALGDDVSWMFRVFSQEDRDQDGVPDDVEPILGLNPNIPDTDGDGIIDGDEDFDQDGLSNSGEIILGTNPADNDSDDNGILDGDEDRDFDSLTDGEEIAKGSNPFTPDSDNDGIADIDEFALNTDPNDPNSRPPRRVYANPVSYLNAILGQEADDRVVYSQPISYLNAILGQEANDRVVYSQPISYLNAILGQEADDRFVYSQPVSYLNAILGQEANNRFVYSQPVSYLNAILGQEADDRFVYSQPVSYLNAILGQEANNRFVYSQPVSYLNAILGQEADDRFAASLIVSFENEEGTSSQSSNIQKELSSIEE